MDFLLGYMPYILMIAGGSIALIGYIKQKGGSSYGQPLLLLGAIFAVAAAVWNLFGFFNEKSALAKADVRFLYVEGKITGQEIASRFSGKRILVVIDSTKFIDYYGERLPDDKVREDYVLKGLKDGIDGRCEIEEIYQEIPKKPRSGNGNDSKPPLLDPNIDPGVLNKLLLKKVSKADVIVLHLPIKAMSLQSILGINALKGKQVVMINQRFTSDSGTYFATAASGAIDKNSANLVLSVVQQYDGDVKSVHLPANDRKCFDLRYSLITPENYEKEIARATTIP